MRKQDIEEGSFWLYACLLGAQLGVVVATLYVAGSFFFMYIETLAYRIVAVFLLLILFSNIVSKTVTDFLSVYARIFSK